MLGACFTATKEQVQNTAALCRPSLHGPKGRSELQGRAAREGFHKEGRGEVVLGTQIHTQGHVLNFIFGSPAILASPVSHTRYQWLP